MTRYTLNTTVGNFNNGDIVTEKQIKKLLTRQQCIACGWLLPAPTRKEVDAAFTKLLQNAESILEDYVYDITGKYRKHKGNAAIITANKKIIVIHQTGLDKFMVKVTGNPTRIMTADNIIVMVCFKMWL